MNKESEAVKNTTNWNVLEQQETYWSNKEVSDFLSVFPFCYTGCQSNLKHGVTLQDLLQPIKNGLDLLQAQDPGLRLHQRLLIFLKYNSGGMYESLLHSNCDVSVHLIKKKSHLFLSTYNNTAELINILLPALTEQ